MIPWGQSPEYKEAIKGVKGPGERAEYMYRAAHVLCVQGV